MAMFGQVAGLAEEMAGTGSRLKKRARIAEEIGKVQAEGVAGDVGLFCLYLAGLPSAESDARKLNAGGALLSKAVKAVTGAGDAELTAAYRRHGDMGAAAFDLLVESRGGPTHHEETTMNGAQSGLTLGEVAVAFDGMAGAKTTAIRAGLVEGLLRKGSALEGKYLLKLMLGDMRIGVKESLVEEGIGVAAGADVAAVRHAVMLEADLGDAAVRAFAGTLGDARMRLFHPLGFMLASPVESPEEAVERFTAKPVKEKVAKGKKGRKKAGAPFDEEMREAMANDVEATLPEDVREGIEAASGMDMDDVRVHLNSGEPERIAAAGYASGSAIHLAAGETEHLAHEAWHVVQQKAGQVEKDDDAGLAAEADAMGARAAGASGVEAFIEDKYDGMRAQVHCGDESAEGRVAIYSRNREDITESFPELVEAFCAVRAGDGIIFDGEILGWDYESRQALPFALLGQRIGRKKVGNDIRVQVPVVFMAFDLMFAEGELWLGRTLVERREKLEEIVARWEGKTVSALALSEAMEKRKKAQQAMFVEEEDVVRVPRLMISPAVKVEHAEGIERAYVDARARANEGVMIKAAGSAYLPGRRGLAWVKLKRVLDTLDVVITGAEYGSGRKSQFLSDYTFAVRDAEGELKNVGKAYSGVTDAEILQLTEFLKAHTLEDYGHHRSVEPLVVLEVAFNNVMRSDRHASGFALRFPRILRIRKDKPLEEIDTVARVEEIYQSQVDKPGEVRDGEEMPG